ncbi:MAG: S8 family serine peptidase, partial [Planctomycetes bacterium]|nr:S8 family serine peptidase [Planctomycetota bacterium]
VVYDDVALGDALGFEVDSGYKIVNFSAYGDSPTAGMRTFIAHAKKHDVLLVTIGRNDRLAFDAAPAVFSGETDPNTNETFDNFIVVGSTNRDGQIHNDSGIQSYIDIFAPGDGIFTTTNNGSYGDSGFGNSFAAPFVAGAAATISNYAPDNIPQEGRYMWVKETLLDNTQNTAGSITRPRLDFGAAVAAVIQGITPPDDGDDSNDPLPIIIFESGGFENYDSYSGFSGWDVQAGSVPASGAVGNPELISVPVGTGMAYLTTGGVGITETRFSQDFIVPDPGRDVQVNVEFSYAVISEEFYRSGDRNHYDEYEFYLFRDDVFVVTESGDTNQMFPTDVDRDSVRIDGISLGRNVEVGSKFVENDGSRNTVGFREESLEYIIQPGGTRQMRFGISIEDINDAAYESRLYVDEVKVTLTEVE